MTVKDTSILAFIGITEDGTAKTLRARVFRAIQKHPSCTRRELAGRTGIKINSLCGRIHELIQAGVISELPARLCRHTGRMSHALVACSITGNNICKVPGRPTIKQLEARLIHMTKALNKIAGTPDAYQNQQNIAAKTIEELNIGGRA